MEGAPGTLYEGEKFQLLFKFSSRYPFDSPQVSKNNCAFLCSPHVLVCNIVVKDTKIYLNRLFRSCSVNDSYFGHSGFLAEPSLKPRLKGLL